MSRPLQRSRETHIAQIHTAADQQQRARDHLEVWRTNSRPGLADFCLRREPLNSGPGAVIADDMTQLEIGKAVEVRTGQRVAILNFGTLLPEAMAAATQLNATVVDMRWVKPMDEAKIIDAASTHELVVTIEENATTGGAGSGVNALLALHGIATPILNLGIPDQFVEHGSHEKQCSWAGLDEEGVLFAITERLNTLQHFKVRAEPVNVEIGSVQSLIHGVEDG